jgi:uncharacterized protein DUF2793
MPPAAPLVGACYIVGSAASGAWAGMTDRIAGWTSGGWRFVAPAEGMHFHVRSTGLEARYRAGAWELGAIRASSLVIGGEQVVGARLAAIESPSGGPTIDAQARTAVAAILTALRTHGLIES